MRRSPITTGIVLGVLAGGVGVAAIAASDSGSAPPPVIVVSGPQRQSQEPDVCMSCGPPAAQPPIEVAGSLPPLSGEARGYRVGSEPASGAVEQLAAAFGIHGPVQQDSGGWVVRENDRLVRVQRAAGVPWFFARFGGPCQVVPGSSAPSEGSTGEALPPVPPSGPTDCPALAGTGTPSSPETATARPAGLPTADEALSKGMETLGKAGLGVSKPVVTDQVSTWRIDASPLIDEKPTSGFGWSITVGPNDEISAASGYLSKPEKAETYKLVGTGVGLERLKAGTSGPLTPTPEARNVTGVQRGLMLGHLRGGAPYLVPAYLFEFEGRPPPIGPVPAVEDRYLSQVPTAVPMSGQ